MLADVDLANLLGDTTQDGHAVQPVSDREAWAYARDHQGFGGDLGAWRALPEAERGEYERGAAGIPTE